MLNNLWSKYLPVIKILLKRSKTGEQVLTINQSDFEKVGLARKTGNKFSLVFKNGRVDNVVIPSPVASELASGLMNDEGTRALLAENDYRIAMNTKYQLHIEQLAREEKEEAAMMLSHA